MSLLDTPRTEAEYASRQARVPPVWILSFPWLTWGMMGGFIVVTLPQMLVAQSIPGDRAAISVAIILTPMFWGVVLSPLLDVRFRRRTYALVFGVASVIAATVTVRYHPVLLEVEIVMLIGFLCCCLFQAAMGGWAGSLIGKGHDSVLGAWSGMYSVGGSGVGALISDYATQNFSPTTAAALTFATFLAPLAVFPLIPAPPQAQVPTAGCFSRFAREVISLPKKREVLIAMALFALPSSSFALTNALGAWSDSFHASPSLVSFISGGGLFSAASPGARWCRPSPGELHCARSISPSVSSELRSRPDSCWLPTCPGLSAWPSLAKTSFSQQRLRQRLP
jgi:PAT family beta-lactamase induction signal transducer AmpG